MMINRYYTTESTPRNEVAPGVLIRHNGRTYTASENAEKGLYAISLIEKTLIRSDRVEIIINLKGTR